MPTPTVVATKKTKSSAKKLTSKTKKLPRRLRRKRVRDLVLFCMDFRFRKGFTAALRKTWKIKRYGRLYLAGGAGNFSALKKRHRVKTILEDMQLAIEKQGVRRIFLVSHEKCGAYANARGQKHVFCRGQLRLEKRFHTQELRESRRVVQKHFPQVKVFAGFTWIDPKTHQPVIKTVA